MHVMMIMWDIATGNQGGRGLASVAGTGIHLACRKRQLDSPSDEIAQTEVSSKDSGFCV